MIWLTKHKKPKDHCPYCRELMFNPDEMKSAALEVLGKERVHELVANERSENKDAVDLTANNTDGTVDESSSANSNHRVMTTQIASRNDNAANNTHNSTDELELEV